MQQEIYSVFVCFRVVRTAATLASVQLKRQCVRLACLWSGTAVAAAPSARVKWIRCATAQPCATSEEASSANTHQPRHARVYVEVGFF